MHEFKHDFLNRKEALLGRLNKEDEKLCRVVKEKSAGPQRSLFS
jgi:hypothetical protein